MESLTAHAVLIERVTGSRLDPRTAPASPCSPRVCLTNIEAVRMQASESLENSLAPATA